MVPIDEARRLVLDRCPVLPSIGVHVDDSIGCVLAIDTRADEDVPPFANTAVDGYAVRACDTEGAENAPVSLSVVGEVAAGAAADVVIGPGQAVRIMTGAPIPEGADAIVMVEDTEFTGDRSTFDGSQRVDIRRVVRPGAAVRAAGDDVRSGELVFEAGTPITPAVAGVLASINVRQPLVIRRPRVAVLSTGDELVDDGSPLRPGQIRESNKVMLLGLVSATGCIAVDFGVVRDDEAALEQTLRLAATECDAIVTSGGVSMGDYDVVKSVLSRIATMTWMQIAIKPAKPFAFGSLTRRDGTDVPVFGLPGNPVSSLVSYELLARPALRKMAGYVPELQERSRVSAIADVDLRRQPDGKVHFQRVITSRGTDGRVHVRPVGAQGSHQLAASALASGLAVVPDGDGIVAGGEVDVVLLAD
ncbi:MAG: molybdopterin molybdotransferase MoeA [Actinomycetota bacterium]|nr:molybdopterin molybdotransferase MoeA [Actinomycetota bacterium]MDA2971081.1 molybdopterin molybdotransferase MoeA [Actinomycetota bacterium]